MRRLVPSPGTTDFVGPRIRAATKNDEGFLRDLSAEVFCQFGDYGSFLPAYLTHPSVFTSICEESESPLGFIMVAVVMSEQPLEGCESAEPITGTPGEKWLDAEIVAIAVAPTHQARGIGRLLMQHAFSFVRTWRQTSPIRSVQLNVADTNRRAREFFSRMGFEVLDPNDGTYPRGQRSIRMVRR